MPKAMTGKQRVLTAIRRQEPDRVPIDYSANEEIHAGLRKHFGLPADDWEGLYRALGVDFRYVGASYVGPKLHADLPGRSVDIYGIRRRWIEHQTGGYWDYCDWPLRDATPEQVEAWPLPSPDHYDYAALGSVCRRHREFAVVYGGAGLGDIINKTGMLRTMEQVLVDLITDEPAGLRLIDRRLDVELEVARRSLEAARGLIDVLMIGEDLGTQRGATLSLALFRLHIRPRLQRFVDLARRFDLPVMIHSCGSSSWAFDDFVEMGISVVDTLQPEAKDMSPEYLKRRFGGRLAFHGMISTAGALAYGTVADVVQDVRRRLTVMMPGGGYMLAPTHCIQSNSPIGNVVAMYDAGRKYGAY
jgi:hypothetical protein